MNKALLRLYPTVALISIALVFSMTIYSCAGEGFFDFWQIRYAGRIFSSGFNESAAVDISNNSSATPEFVGVGFTDDRWAIIDGKIDNDGDEDWYELSETPENGRLEVRAYIFPVENDLTPEPPDWYDFVRSDDWDNLQPDFPIEIIEQLYDGISITTDIVSGEIITLSQDIAFAVIRVYSNESLKKGDRYWICFRRSDE